MVKYFSEIWSTGNSFVITVPKAFVTSKIVEVGKSYEISIDEETTGELDGKKS